MPEIIDLLSSSPVTSPRQVVPSRRLNETFQGHNFLPSLSDETLDHWNDDFTIERSPKRLRLSPIVSDEEDYRTTLHSRRDINYDNKTFLGATSVRKGKQRPSVQSPEIVDLVDDIIFTSSAPGPSGHNRNVRGHDTVHDLSSDDLPDFVLDHQNKTRTKLSSSKVDIYGFSKTTTNILASISDNATKSADLINSTSGALRNSKVRKEVCKSTFISDIDEILSSSQPAISTTATNQRSKRTTEVQQQKLAKRVAAKSAKAEEKAAEKERRRVQKETKALEKQRATEIADANKSKTNKKNAVPEMMIELSGRLRDTDVGKQVEESMKELDVRVKYLDSDGHNDVDDLIKSKLIKWRRKMTAEFDENVGQWEPLSVPRVTTERHIIVYLTADEFASIAMKDTSTDPGAQQVLDSKMKANLDSQLAKLRDLHENCIPILLIQGLSSWLKKGQNAQNRAYAAAVRAQALAENDEAPSTSSSATSRARQRKKKPTTTSTSMLSLTSDIAEDLLLHLQVAHQPILIHHTTNAASTASQISVFTQHLATRPYRLAQLNHNLKSASFCMDSGQVRTGDDPADTYIKMLQEVSRVTPSMAYGIAAQWPTVRALVQGFRTEGNLMLEDVRKSTNKDGGWSDRRLGPMISRRLYKVFMGKDPSARDGMA